jgi:large subunit ribosomal protein L1
MPNPKAGTVTADVAKAVTEFKGGRIEYRNDRYGNIHVPVGKVSFEVGQLVDNLVALVAEVVRVKPSSSKGRYVQSLSVSSTMGPAVKVEITRIEDLTALAG